MFGIGETELLIIVAFGFMIFGPDKLPGMGRTVGRALRQFRQAQEGFTEVVQTEVMDPLQEAMNDPLDAGTRKRRRPTAEERAAALAQDADIDTAGGGAAPARKETFAERKARLAAEREAREGEEPTQAQAAADTGASAQPFPTTGQVAHAQEPAAAASDTSAAALYAMGGRSSFGDAKERAAAQAVPDATQAADPPRSAADAAETDGKEVGDIEA